MTLDHIGYAHNPEPPAPCDMPEMPESLQDELQNHPVLVAEVFSESSEKLAAAFIHSDEKFRRVLEVEIQEAMHRVWHQWDYDSLAVSRHFKRLAA